jgi:hypothetical protein
MGLDFCRDRPGVMVQLETRFNRDFYTPILENRMPPSVIRVYPNQNFVFQQDNCPVHTVQRVTAWFQNHNVTVLNRPSRSPDLNQIENMWGLLTPATYNMSEEGRDFECG